MSFHHTFINTSGEWQYNYYYHESLADSGFDTNRILIPPEEWGGPYRYAEPREADPGRISTRSNFAGPTTALGQAQTHSSGSGSRNTERLSYADYNGSYNRTNAYPRTVNPSELTNVNLSGRSPCSTPPALNRTNLIRGFPATPQSTHQPSGPEITITTSRHSDPLSCSMCETTFTGKWRKPNLDRHVETIHKNPQTYWCEVCSRTFSRPDNLKKHLREIHGIY